MRRTDREITVRSEMLEVARRCDVCHIAFADENTAYSVPMNFGMTEDGGKVALWFHCAPEGRKLDMLARNSRVAFSMSTGHVLEWEDSGHCTMRYESVCGSGVMHIAEDEEKAAGMDAVMNHYRPASSQKREPQYPADLLRRTTILKLDVEEMTGKRSAPKG